MRILHRRITRAAAIIGMFLAGTGVAISTAAESPSTPTKGPVPDSAFGEEGGVDVAQVPDYVPALGQEGKVVGYVAKTDIMPSPDGLTGPTDEAIPVLDDTLTKIVGHMYPGRGFVPIGSRPEDVPKVPVTVVEE